MQCSAGLCYDKKGRRSQMFKEGWKAIRDTSGRHSHKQSTTCRARGLRDQWGRGAKRNEREKRKHQDYNKMAREFGPRCVQMGFTSLLSASPAPGLSQLPRNSSCPRGLCQTGVESISQWRWPNVSAKVGRNCEGSGHFVADHCLSWRRRIKSCWGNRIVSWCDVMGELDHLLITEKALQKFCLKKIPNPNKLVMWSWDWMWKSFEALHNQCSTSALSQSMLDSHEVLCNATPLSSVHACLFCIFLWLHFAPGSNPLRMNHILSPPAFTSHHGGSPCPLGGPAAFPSSSSPAALQHLLPRKSSQMPGSFSCDALVSEMKLLFQCPVMDVSWSPYLIYPWITFKYITASQAVLNLSWWVESKVHLPKYLGRN